MCFKLSKLEIVCIKKPNNPLPKIIRISEIISKILLVLSTNFNSFSEIMKYLSFLLQIVEVIKFFSSENINCFLL